METLTFKGTEKEIEASLSPLNLLPINQIDFMKKALRSNLNNLQVDENIYLNRLREQYKEYIEAKKTNLIGKINTEKYDYQAMRLFCLDTELISFNDIELMENEVNQSF